MDKKVRELRDAAKALLPTKWYTGTGDIFAKQLSNEFMFILQADPQTVANLLDDYERLIYQARNVIQWFADEGHDGRHPYPCVPCQSIHHLRDSLTPQPVDSPSTDDNRAYCDAREAPHLPHDNCSGWPGPSAIQDDDYPHLADSPKRCPRCNSHNPKLHPAVQHEGEVHLCSHPWHGDSPEAT